jgi:hypothetical protein
MSVNNTTSIVFKGDTIEYEDYNPSGLRKLATKIGMDKEMADKLSKRDLWDKIRAFIAADPSLSASNSIGYGPTQRLQVRVLCVV